MPFWLFWMMALGPPRFEAMTGVPRAWASMMVLPNGSGEVEACTKMSNWLMRWRASSLQPSQ